jgi:hypothetical protein
VTTELRAWLERERRAKLHQQIVALKRQLAVLNGRHSANFALSRIKLQHKIWQLELELTQPMLFDLSRRGGTPSET